MSTLDLEVHSHTCVANVHDICVVAPGAPGDSSRSGEAARRGNDYKLRARVGRCTCPPASTCEMECAFLWRETHTQYSCIIKLAVPRTAVR